MGVMTTRELNANVSQALARANAGETVVITKNGMPQAELRPPRPVRDAAWQAAYQRMLKRMDEGIGLGPIGTITDEDKRGPYAP